MIQQTEHVVRPPHLPEALRGLRVAQLSDLHRSRYTSDALLRHAVALSNAAAPDLVLLTGDFVTSDPADIEPCAQIVGHLRARLGIFASLGNHDYTAGGPAVERALRQRGIQVLVNRSVRLENGLHIVGLDDDRNGRPDVERAFAGIRPCEPVLAMVHNPGYAERLADRECIIFSGHTHGGQIRVPILTARQVRIIGAKHYRAGWFTLKSARMYVTRGLGRVGLPLRLFCRPEIALFTLEPS